MLACPNCGANLRFDPKSQRLKCDFCGGDFDPEELKEGRGADEQVVTETAPVPVSESGEQTEGEEESFSTYVFTCPQCGGELLSYDDTLATFCSFCGASTVLESRMSNEKRPKFIIPFRLTREESEAAYKKMVSRALFAPAKMKAEATVENFRGIYMPYWIYGFDCNKHLNITGTKTHRSGDYVITKYYDLTSDMLAEYEGISYDASSSFADSLSEAIAPFDSKEAVPFQSNYLSGFYADSSDVSEEIYRKQAEDMVRSDLAEEIRKAPGYHRYSIDGGQVLTAALPDRTTSERGMFPVWFLSTRMGDRVSYAVVNGQTGKVAADLPVSFTKYLIGSILLALPLFFLFQTEYTIRPTTILTMSMGVALISMLISNSQLNRIFAREHRLDDKGYNSTRSPEEVMKMREELKGLVKVKSAVEKNDQMKTLYLVFTCIFLFLLPAIGILMLISWTSVLKDEGKSKKVIKPGKTVIKAPMKEKMKSLWKPLAAIGAAVLIFIANPVSDMYYYAGALVSMALVGWSFWDVVQEHNMLSTRPLPQFGRRGGDENEH